MSGLPREVLKWLQSLDLTYPVRNTRRDFSNGYLIAEIFSWYYPQEIQMHSFDNGNSIETKIGNWSIIQRSRNVVQRNYPATHNVCGHILHQFFQRQDFAIPREETEGTIHCKPGASSLLIQRIYSILTNRRLPTLPKWGEVDFSDSSYQEQLPFHARSTATQAIKNNIANSEFYTDPDSILCGKKAQEIIKVHIRNRQQQKKEDPERFGIKPNLCERSPRKITNLTSEEFCENVKNSRKTNEPKQPSVRSMENHSLKEISVKQHNYSDM